MKKLWDNILKSEHSADHTCVCGCFVCVYISDSNCPAKAGNPSFSSFPEIPAKIYSEKSRKSPARQKKKKKKGRTSATAMPLIWHPTTE